MMEVLISLLLLSITYGFVLFAVNQSLLAEQKIIWREHGLALIEKPIHVFTRSTHFNTSAWLTHIQSVLPHANATIQTKSHHQIDIHITWLNRQQSLKTVVWR